MKVAKPICTDVIKSKVASDDMGLNILGGYNLIKSHSVCVTFREIHLEI